MDQSKKSTYIVAAIAFILIAVAVYFLFIFQKGSDKIEEDSGDDEIQEITKLNISDRPFVTLTPTSDGAEIIISIENMQAFDQIEYELTYLADNPEISGAKIQRGSVGTDVITSESKYKKSILLGTASRGVRSPDTGVTDGKLTLSMFQEDNEFESETEWNLFQAGLTSDVLTTLSGNFSLEIPALGKNYWIIVADTVGVPPSASIATENVLLPIYGVFSVSPDLASAAELKIQTSKSQENLQLFTFISAEDILSEVDSEYNSETGELSASVDSFASYIVVSSQ